MDDEDFVTYIKNLKKSTPIELIDNKENKAKSMHNVPAKKLIQDNIPLSKIVREAKIRNDFTTSQLYNSQNSFQEVYRVISEINHAQRQFSMLKLAEENILYRVLLKTWDFVRQLIGKPSLYNSYMDLFSKNIRNMEELENVANAIFSDAKKENDRLVELVDNTTLDSERIYHTKESLKEKIPEIVSQYEKICQLMDGMKEGDEKEGITYWELKRERKKLERKIDTLGYGALPMILDKQRSNKEISEFYENMEKLFRFSYLIAERIRESSAEITRVLRETQITYSKFDKVFEAANACKKGLAILVEYHSDLNNKFTTSLQQMIGIIHSDPNIHLFKNTNPKLAKLIGDIESIEYSQNYTKEMLLEEI
jgi:predicted  nucleic acid-binding Zn-ribbon protein